MVFETRSGNLNRPQQNWSPWEKLSAGRIVSPAARFLEYRATLSGTAELSEVDVAYQMKNVAPVIQELEITPANYKFPAPSGIAISSNATLIAASAGAAFVVFAGRLGFRFREFSHAHLGQRLDRRTLAGQRRQRRFDAL